MRWIRFLLVFSLFIYLILRLEYHYDTSSQKVSIQFTNKNIYQNFSKETFIEKSKFFLKSSDSLKDINIVLLEELIADNNYVEKAEVYLDLEDTINIYIAFREPFVKVLRNNKIYYVDSEGVVLPALKNFKNDLMVLSGDMNWEDLSSVFTLVEDIYNDDILGELIGGIHYNAHDGYILSSKLCDLGINIGKQPVFDFNKVKQIELFLIYMSEQKGCDYCEQINLEYNNQVICVN